jgi:anion-transporting  ArsA/GET3 family ATPase
MSGWLGDLIATRRLLVFVGEGGVGKTSSAAAAAIAAARAGRHVAVLTVDPAPRLGDVLGLGSFDERPRPVALNGIESAGGSVMAMRLDTKRTFDRVVQQLAPSPEAARKVLEHPIYMTISGSLGGSQSYMAFQRLYELSHLTGRGPQTGQAAHAGEAPFDLLVIDTPPAASAAELLAAPLRLSALLETGATSVLANPALVLARAGSSVVRASAAILLPLLQRATGLELRKQVAEFADGFADVLAGLSERAGTVDALLRADDTAFVAVVQPRVASVDAAIDLERSLAQAGISLEAIVVNRMTPAPGPERTTPRAERLTGAPTGTLEAVARMEGDLDGLRAAEAGAVTKLREALAGRDVESAPGVVEIASLAHDISTLEDLAMLATALQGRAAAS